MKLLNNYIFTALIVLSMLNAKRITEANDRKADIIRILFVSDRSRSLITKGQLTAIPIRPALANQNWRFIIRGL